MRYFSDHKHRFFILTLLSGSILGLPAVGGPARATEIGEMIGVYRSGGDGHYLWMNDDWKGLTEKWKELGKDGLRLVDVERHVIDGKAR